MFYKANVDFHCFPIYGSWCELKVNTVSMSLVSTTVAQHSRMKPIHSICNFMLQHHLFLVNITCFVAFSIQFTSVLKGFLDRTQTNINKHEEDLHGKNFPVILKICINPGFSGTAVNEAGYKNIFHFFSGRSKYNLSIYGWQDMPWMEG